MFCIIPFVFLFKCFVFINHLWIQYTAYEYKGTFNLYALRPLLHLQINANIYVHRFKKVSGPKVFKKM